MSYIGIMQQTAITQFSKLKSLLLVQVTLTGRLSRHKK